MLIAHRIALEPTNVQRSYFLRASGVARFSWNWALAQWRRQYEARQADPSVPAPTDAALRRDLNRRKRAEFPWMYDVTKCASQEAVIDLGMAFRAFFREAGALSPVQAQGRPRALLCGQRGGDVPRAGPAPAPAGRRLGADARGTALLRRAEAGDGVARGRPVVRPRSRWTRRTYSRWSSPGTPWAWTWA